MPLRAASEDRLLLELLRNLSACLQPASSSSAAPSFGSASDAAALQAGGFTPPVPLTRAALGPHDPTVPLKWPWTPASMGADREGAQWMPAPRGTAVQDTAVVAFTCGHCFYRRHFSDVVLPGE